MNNLKALHTPLLPALLCTFLVAGASASQPNWVGLASPHFVIYVSENTPATQSVLEKLERARLLFEQIGLAQPDLKSIAIVAFSSERDYANYRINPGAYAFYQRTYVSDCVVMRDLAPEHYDVAVHEYTHFVIEHSGYQKLPLWLNEGLADFYSTVEVQQGAAVLGASPQGRLASLERRHWIDWTTIAAVDQQSPYYRQLDKMLAFYAQSWALVRMLAMEQPYASHFRDFLQAISSGQPVATAFQANFGKTIEEAGAEVEELVRAKALCPRASNIALSVPSFELKPVDNATLNAQFALADVLSVNPQTAAQAKAELAGLAAEYPNDPRSYESLGFACMREGAERDAMGHFEAALARHSQNSEVLFRFVHMKMQSEGPNDHLIGLLQGLLERDPANYNARLELGFAAARLQNYGAAINALQNFNALRPEHRYIVYYTLAYSFIQSGEGVKARSYALKAQQIAATDSDRAQIAGLVSFINQEEPVQVASR